MSDKFIAKIYATMDFKKFKLLHGNRKISKSHTKRLTASMGMKNVPAPIIVNDKFEVIDGQHRLRAAMDLNAPITYQIIPGLGLDDVQLLNTNTSNWKLSDYLDSYINLGKTPYIDYKAFMEKYNFLHEQNFALLNNGKYSGALNEKFKDGKLEISANQLNWGSRSASKILDMGHFFMSEQKDKSKNRWFVIACCKAFKNKQYSHEQMLHKLKIWKGGITHQASIQDYSRKLEEIYFYKTKESDRFRLD